MDNHPLVSIIIPNYNHARFLEERIQSVLNQTYQNFELIILDDKSTDNSLEIINKYKDDPHISHIVINEENTGSPFKQWTKGFSLTKGDLIWIAESDDSCSPFFLEKLVPLHIDSGAVLTFCRSQRMDEDGRLLTTWHNEMPTDKIWEGKDFIERYLGKYNIVTNASSAIFNRAILEIIPEDYLNYKGAGDWLFWLEISRRGKVRFCSESLNYFRFHENNTTAICYSNGANYYEGKIINDYLYNEGLVSEKVYKQNIRNNIFKIRSLTFDSEERKSDLLSTWGYNISFKIKHIMSLILNKLDSCLWK